MAQQDLTADMLTRIRNAARINAKSVKVLNNKLNRGIAVACGLCPELGDVDPYWMAVCAIDEALRNVVCVGAAPNRIAILDNFCWPKVDNERSLGALVRTCRGAYDAAVAYGLPEQPCGGILFVIAVDHVAEFGPLALR